jgi:hypothetical protein
MASAALLVAAIAAAAPSAAAGPDAPSNHAVLFYNARLALREERPTDVLKLWLLRNALVDRGEERGAEDDEFRSVVWAALGRLGLCQDGFAQDSGGAGLWPVAFHNWLVDALQKGPPPSRPPPWDAFTAGRQQRFISLQDVLSPAEMRSVAFFRGLCLGPYLAALERGESPLFELKDRARIGSMMQDLLRHARKTVHPDKVQNLAVLEARIFDLELALTELLARKARREGGVAAQ